MAETFGPEAHAALAAANRVATVIDALLEHPAGAMLAALLAAWRLRATGTTAIDAALECVMGDGAALAVRVTEVETVLMKSSGVLGAVVPALGWRLTVSDAAAAEMTGAFGTIARVATLVDAAIVECLRLLATRVQAGVPVAETAFPSRRGKLTAFALRQLPIDALGVDPATDLFAGWWWIRLGGRESRKQRESDEQSGATCENFHEL